MPILGAHIDVDWEGTRGNWDSEYDIFSYGVGSTHGKFAFRDRASFADPILLPYKPVRIRGVKYQNGNSLSEIIIHDEMGVRHAFGTVGSTFGAHESPSYVGSIGSPINSWLIGEITSAVDPANTIGFEYDFREYPEYSVLERRDQLILDDANSWEYLYFSAQGSDHDYMLDYMPYSLNKAGRLTFPGCGPGVDCVTPTTVAVQYANAIVQKEIVFRSGKVVFTPASVTGLLETVEVFNRGGERVQTVKLRYREPSPMRYLLAEVRFLDNRDTTVLINKYRFSYQDEHDSFPGRLTTAIDHWGYYNGKHGNETLFHDFGPITYIETKEPTVSGAYVITKSTFRATADRSPDVNFMKRYVLREIQYPTGGRTEFDYEANKYYENEVPGVSEGSIREAGGLRIKEINNYDEHGTKVKRRAFTYGGGQVPYGYLHEGTGIMEVRPDSTLYCITQQGYVVTNSDSYYGYRRRIFSSEPYVDLAPHGSPVVYPLVTEQEYEGNSISFSRKADYRYAYMRNPLPDYSRTNPAIFTNIEIPYERKRYVSRVKGWDSGQPLSQVTTASSGATFSRTYEYEDTVREEFRGLRHDRHVAFSFYDPTGTRGYLDFDEDVYHQSSPIWYPWHYADYHVVSGERRLKREIEARDGVTDTTEYEYDQPVHGLPTRIATHTSKGEELIKELRYPHDFAVGPTETQPANVYHEMAEQRNMVAPVIEELTYKNQGAGDVLLSGIKTNYKKWDGNIIAPDTVEAKTGSAPYETRLRYHSYDGNGNVLTVSQEGGAPVSYLWGYKGTLPIAKLENAAFRQDSSTTTPTSQLKREEMVESRGYELDGSCSIASAQTVSISWTYYRTGEGVQDCTLEIYESSDQLYPVLTFNDSIPIGTATVGGMTQEALPAGSYTAKVTIESGLPSSEEDFNIDVYVDIQQTVTGVAYTVPFHTSFEEEQGADTTYARTGRRSHQGSYTVKLPASGQGNNTYILSYWKKASGTAEWEHVEAEITVTSATPGNQVIGQAGGYVDEVRLYPAEAQMTTYTYDPLVGMTSATDANNRTTSYEYDGFGRLKAIRDHEGNIVQSHDYHYAGQ